MKKILLLILCLICVTGCGKDTKVAKELFCYGEDAAFEELGFEVEINVKFNAKEETISADMTVSADLEALMNGMPINEAGKEGFLKSIKQEFTESYGLKFISSDTKSNVVKSKFSMYEDNKYLGSLENKDMTNYNAVKKQLEKDGYVCSNNKDDFKNNNSNKEENIIDESTIQNTEVVKELVCSNVHESGAYYDLNVGFNSDNKVVTTVMVMKINLEDYYDADELTDEVKEEFMKSYQDSLSEEWENSSVEMIGNEVIVTMDAFAYLGKIYNLYDTDNLYKTMKAEMIEDGYTCK